jgi:hypothetical protein
MRASPDAKMKKPTTLLGLTLVAALGLFVPGLVAQDNGNSDEPTEQILSYDSDITVHQDASMQVREIIKVRALGEQIKHGIYRDFPTVYKDRAGNRYSVGFEVNQVLRDDRPEDFRVEDQRNGKRIYIGDKDTTLAAGIYTYTITYTTSRQLGFFADHDELYWNVTGNAWIFPIEKVSATVHLPSTGQPVDRRALHLGGYTGPEGSTEKALHADFDSLGNPVFVATRPLEAYEGLTIVVGWPKGLVTAPSREQKIHWFIADHQMELVGAGGLVVVFLYYLATWFVVGRDPRPGTIMPLYEPPAEFSPAAVRFLTHMGFDDKTFAAAIVSMAVKKYLKIEQKHDHSYSLQLVSGASGAAQLARDERLVADTLFADDKKKIDLVQSNHSAIREAREQLRSTLTMTEEKTYFVTNSRYVIPGLVLTVVSILAAIICSGDLGKIFPAAFMCVWLSGWSFGVYSLARMTFTAWRSARSAGTIFGALFISAFALPFFAGEVGGFVFLAWSTSPLMVAIVATLLGSNILFHHLLKAPTHAGRLVLDKIEGFKMFLAATEADRMKYVMPLEQTPATFEKFLPYAIALDCEKQWASQFAFALGTAASAGTSTSSYSPGWYSGPGIGSLGAAGFASSLGDSFSGSIASASTAPGSSSGGGGFSGGSSGGGGGGGGGGGW